MRKLILFFAGLLALDTPAGAQQQARSFPNIGVGIGHRAADGRLSYHFNVGLLNHVDTLRGFQAGLFSSVVRGRLDGVQVGGLITAVHSMQGAQLSLLTNVSSTPMRGLQVAGVTNISMGVKRGVQMAGIANVCAGYMRGLQMAAYNYADSLNGSQIGIINVAAAHPRGVQIGLVNCTRDTVAHKIGLVNINPKTRIDLLAFGGTTSKLNAALRFRNRSTYSIIGVGSHYMGFDEEFSGAIYYRIGQYFNLSRRLSISGDVGYYHVETFQKNSQAKPERLYSLQAHLNADYQINRTLGAFVSTGYGDTRYYGGGDYRHRLLLQAGLSFRYNRK